MAFRSIGEVSVETLKYIKDRKMGAIKSCKTGYKKLDKCLLGGIEWGSVLSIGGRPSVGKTAFSSCLIRGILQNNPLADLEILDFIWEMSGRSMLIRDLSAMIRTSYGDIISAEQEITDNQYNDVVKAVDKVRELPWYMEEEPKSTKAFADAITRRVEGDKKKKRIVRVDHTILAKQAADEASQVTMLQNLLGECVKLKKQSDIIFILLTQIGREFETRQENGTFNAYPRRSDPFGGDAVAQGSETVILLNKPSAYGISYYGQRPHGMMLVDDDDLFAHIVKNRNSPGDKMIHYKENFKYMSITEM